VRELALHLLDVAQNALEAGATRLAIEIEEDLAADRLTISVKDNGRGMDADLLAKVRDPFTTTRTTRRVGLGIPLLTAAAERCNGGIEIASQPGQGTAVTATFQHSHIDRAPLGDVAGTLVTVILARPDLELTYRHRVGEREFAFSSAELREQLGDVPLNLAPVIQWVREYLSENLAALYETDETNVLRPTSNVEGQDE